MADQAATAFERGRESVLAELHAAAPATYFPLTLRGLIAYGQVAVIAFFAEQWPAIRRAIDTLCAARDEDLLAATND